MKVRAIAIAPHDGWAFIVKEEKIFLLRPPYVPSDLDEVSEKVVENAVGTYGFEECDITFDSIDEVIRFLKDQFVKSRKDLGIEVPSSKELRKLLEYASDNVLLEYLRRAEEELIPERKLRAAESIASDLMKLEQVRNSPEMKRMATRILEKCKKDRKRFEEDILVKAKLISREIVNKEFPEEKEYFDFLFDLTIEEIKELEPGKEAEFLRQMRAVHPELATGYAPIIIILTVQILTEATYQGIAEDIIEKRIAGILENEGSNKVKIPVISKYLTEYSKEKNYKRIVSEDKKDS